MLQFDEYKVKLNNLTPALKELAQALDLESAERELDMLPLSTFAITLELATRFLKDHLDGDKYFKISYPQQNLERARGQIRLAANMLAKMQDMEQIVAQIRTNMT